MSKLKHLSTFAVLTLVFGLSLSTFLLVRLAPLWLYHTLDSSAYLVFHNTAELFSIMVSLSIFGVGWYAYNQSKDRHALLLSCAFLAIGLMDLMHTLGYAGMPDFITPNSANKSTQFWITARFLSAMAFFASAFVYAGTQSRLLSKQTMLSSSIIGVALVFIGVTYFPSMLPATFVEGKGLTIFKVYSEYTIIALFAGAFAVYWKRYERTQDRLLLYYLSAFIICIFSELAFTTYESVFDTYNILGHIYKIVAFFLFYKGIFAASVRRPYADVASGRKLLQKEMADRKHIEGMLTDVFESITDAFVALDSSWRYTYVNKKAGEMFGRKPEDLLGKHIWAEFPEGIGQPFYKAYYKAMEEQRFISLEEYYPPYDRWFENRIYPANDGLSIYFQDITERKRAERILASEKQVLEMISEGAALPEVLKKIVLSIESLSQETIASILLLDADGRHVHYGAAPNLPEAYNRAIEGSEIGPSAGSCGTAAYRKAPVIVSDIDTDPLWADYRVLAQAHGLRACWSTPIMNSEEKVLGTFAMYYREPRNPREEDFTLIARTTHIAGIAIERNRAEEALQREKKVLRLFIEHSPAAIAMLDRDMKYIAVSRRYLEDYELGIQDLIGRSHYEVFSEMPERWKEIHRRCLAGAVERSEEDPFPRTDGSLDWVRWEIRPWYEKESELGGIILFSEVITERKQAEEALREGALRLKAAVMAAKVGLWDWDLKTNKVLFSPEWKAQIGHADHEITNDFSEWERRVHPEDLAGALHTIQSFIANPYANFSNEFRFRHKDGTYRWILAQASLQFDEAGKPVRMLGSHIDITESKRIKELDRLKSMFIAAMSHELRTPLNAVIGFSSILLKQWKGPLNDDQQLMLSTVLRSGKHLLALINDVIDVSKVEAGKIDVQRNDFDLYDIIGEAAELIKKDVVDKGLELQVDPVHLNMKTDRRRLLQCVLNLLSNAVKFTPKGKVRIAARIEPVIGKPETVVIVIEDTGIGIKQEDLPMLFQAFKRLDSPLRATVLGTGLGLYLTRKLAIEVFKGDITASSEFEKGSRFTLMIPLGENNS